VTVLRPVVLAVPATEQLLRGPERVAAQSAHARLALARSARLSAAALGALRKGTYDEPLPSNGWHWSVSHARGFSAGVVAHAPVGIDVETVQPRRSDLVRRVAGRAELELLGGFTWASFYRLWTAKEAVLKKAGCGILELSGCTLVAAPASDCLVLHHRGHEHPVALLVRAGHVAAISCDEPLPVEWTWVAPAEVAP
jgi:4'-phosphopantetheinyl transferase